jgi:hypothetical protein
LSAFAGSAVHRMTAAAAAKAALNSPRLKGLTEQQRIARVEFVAGRRLLMAAACFDSLKPNLASWLLGYRVIWAVGKLSGFAAASLSPGCVKTPASTELAEPSKDRR